MNVSRLAMLARVGHLAMADDPAAPAGGGNPAPADPADPAGKQGEGDPADLGEAGRRALAAERKRADDAERARKGLEAQLRAKDDESLTETQRLRKQLDELTDANAKAQSEATRHRVIAAEQVPPSLAEFVRGDDETAMVASAKALKAAIAEATKPGTPAPDYSQGSHPATGAGPDAALRQFTRNLFSQTD